MIGICYLNGTFKDVFGCNAWEIEGFEDAIKSDELYIPHHVLEYKYSVEELVSMNRYYKVSPDELIWVSEKVHNGNSVLHKGHKVANENRKGKHIKPLGPESRKKLSEAMKRRKLSEEHKRKIAISNSKPQPNSEFGNKYYNHYGYSKHQNEKQYKKEYAFYSKYNHKCSWEVLNNYEPKAYPDQDTAKTEED